MASTLVVGAVTNEPPSAFAVVPLTLVSLGSAASFSVISGASIGNTATGPVTTLRGDMGVTALNAITGFPPGVVTGTIHNADAQAAQAMVDLVAAFNDAAGRTDATAFAGDQIGVTVTAGLYHSAGAVSNTGVMTLDAANSPDAVFIFQVGGALGMAAASEVKLINGAQASHVFWQVNAAATLGAGAKFAGTLMALDAIGVGAGAVVNGRVLARTGAVALNSNEFYTRPPALTITGGASVSATTSTPLLSGSTDLAAGQIVTVTVAGQTLPTVVQAGGAWSTTTAPIINGTYAVVVTAADSQGNITTATQSLTIDTILPVVTIAGGAIAATNDSTPTITGTSDEATGTTVTVTGAGATMTALVQSGGTWNTTPAAALADAIYSVSVSVTDPAGNVGVATQSLTVDTNTTTTTTTTVPSTTTTTDPIPAPLPAFSAVAPTRLFDTRSGESLDAARPVAKHKVGGADELQVVVTGIEGLVPAVGVGAVSLNITVTNPDSDGFLTVYACGTRELVSSVNYRSGQTVANAVIAPVSPVGSVCIFSSAPADVIGDFNGWFPIGGVFAAVGPKRVFDTRADQLQPSLRTVTKNAIASDTSIEVQLTDLPGLVPSQGVSAVSLNVTVTNAVAAGFITVFDCGTRELVSSVNFVADRTVANAVIAPVSATGAVCFYSSTTTDLVVDINGWLRAGSGYSSVSPQRVVDTRPGQPSKALRVVPSQQIGGDYVLQVKVTDLPGVVPASGVGAVSLNITATETHADGYVTVYPCGSRPEASNLNYASGQIVANAVITRVSAMGTICIYAQTPIDIVVDINGWFSSSW